MNCQERQKIITLSIKILCVAINILWCNISLGQFISSENSNIQLLKSYTNISIIDTVSLEKQKNYALTLIKKNPDSCIKLLFDIAQKNIQLKSYLGIASAFTNIATCYVENGNYDKGIMYYHKALSYAHLYTDKVKLAMLYSSMTGPWFYKGEYDSAAAYAYQAAKMLLGTKIMDAKHGAYATMIYNNLGTLWYKLGKSDNSIFYYKRAEAIAQPYRDSDNLIQTYMALGCIYRVTYPDTTFYYFQKATRIDNGKNGSLHANIQNNWGGYYLSSKQPARAIKYLKDAIFFEKKENDLQGLVTSSLNLAQAYFQLQDYMQSKQIINNTLVIVKKINYSNLYTLQGAYSTLSTIYKIFGNDGLAYDWLKKENALQDSIMNMELNQSANALETSQIKMEKNKEIAQSKLLIILKNNQLREKNFLIVLVNLAVFFLVLLSISLYRTSKHKQKLQGEQINVLQQEQEIRQLRAILNGEEKERTRIARELHDGVASQLITVKLNVDLLRKKKSKIVEAHEMDNIFQQLHEASIELHKTAQNLIPDIIIENGLEIAIQILCDKLQKNTKIDINFEIFGTLPKLHSDIELSLYRMIQELLQNVLKHAGATYILVQFLYRNQILNITIEDNGKGFLKDKIHKGLGLQNVEERVKMLNGTMIINSSNNIGTIIYLEFNVFMLLKDKINGL